MTVARCDSSRTERTCARVIRSAAALIKQPKYEKIANRFRRYWTIDVYAQETSDVTPVIRDGHVRSQPPRRSSHERAFIPRAKSAPNESSNLLCMVRFFFFFFFRG